jgi:hypothetical protein
MWSPAELEQLKASRLRYGIGRVLSQLAGDVLGQKIKPATAARRARQLADWIEAELAPPKPPEPKQDEFELEHPEPQPTNDVKTVFAHWQVVTGRRNSRLTPGRAKAIKDRLECFTVADLCLAIDRAQTSRFWSGEASNDGASLDLEAYMGSHRHIEQLLHEARETGQQSLLPQSPIDREIEELEDKAAELTREGRIDEANDVQRQIGDLLRKSQR